MSRPLLIVPTLLCSLSFAGAHAQLRLGIYGIRGPSGAAAAATAELGQAFGRLKGIEVLSRVLVRAKLRKRAHRLPHSWTRSPARVRRLLAGTGIDLLVTGRVFRDGRRKMVVAMVLSASSGRVLSAVRVERGKASFTARLDRIARRLRDMSFAALGRPVHKRKAVALAPLSVPLPAPAPEPTETSEPTDTTLEPTAPDRILRARIDLRPTRSLLQLAAGVGLLRFVRSGASASGFGGWIDLQVFPWARSGGWSGNFGFDLGFEASGVFQSIQVAALSAEVQYVRARPGLTYRWKLGRHELRVLLGYDMRQLQATVGGIGTERDHLVALGLVATFAPGGGAFRLAPILRVWPVGGFQGRAGHRLGVGGGLDLRYRFGGAAIGVRYLVEHFRGSSGATVDASIFNETLHSAALFAAYRY